MPRTRLVLVCLLALSACGGSDDRSASAPRAVTPIDPATAGSIAGVVRFDGTPPTMSTLPLASWPACSAGATGPVYAGDVLVKDGLVQNAFVYIKDGLGDRTFAVPEQKVTIDQLGCQYVPRIAGAQVGQPIDFLNSDATLHNVHGSPIANPGWNFMLPVKGADRAIRVAEPEVMIAVRCDLHPWMRGYLGVLAHPYFAVTGPDGRFTLKDVPPGTYTVAAWHERFGTRETQVTLPPHGAQDVTLTFTPSG